MKKLLTIPFFIGPFLYGEDVLAQLQITTGQSAQQLAELIAGPGVTVSNASITGGPTAIGAFTSGTNNPGLGIDSGVIMSSGNVQDAAAPATAFASSVLNLPGEQYLANQAGVASNDAIVLQFDFVPNADYVQFQYVFASEEYPEWVCSSFNDMFAFTIEGVTVAMPQTNIAVIPGTTIPVAINTINDDPLCGGNYVQYYVDNWANNQVVYDGMTTVLTAEAIVICGETYRLRLMLSDGGDFAYDSGCFIEENSLTTGSVVIETVTPAANSTAYEGCNDATVSLTLNGAANTQDFPVPIWISQSTAEWGIDYDPIPQLNLNDSTLIIPAGQNTVTFGISPVNDNMSEGPEYIEFIAITSTCGLTDTFRIYINDLVQITTTTSNDTTICIGNAIGWCEASGGGGLFTYTWDNGLGVADTIFPAPTVTTTYVVSVTDNCGSAPVEDSVTVTVDGGPVAFAGNDVSVCIGGSVLLNATSNALNSTFSWDPPTELSNANISNPLCTPSAPIEYVVTVTRLDGCSNTDTVQVSLTPPPTSEFQLPSIACAGDPVIVDYTGNANAAAQYQWNFDGGIVTNGSGMGPIAVLWSLPGVYDVELTVAWGGCISSVETNAIEVFGPPTVNAGPDIAFCSGNAGPIGSAPVGGVSYSWNPTTGVADPSTSATTAGPANSSHSIQVFEYVLMAEEHGCKSYDTVEVTVYPIPTAEFAIPPGKCFTVNSFDLLATGFFGPNATYSWDFGPVGFPSTADILQPEGVIFNEPGPQTVTLIVEDNGCLSQPFVGVVDVYEMPVADFSVDVTEGCERLPVAFTDQSYNGNSVLHRTWLFGDGASATQVHPSHVYEAGLYTIRLDVVTGNGCADHIVKTNLVEVYPKPSALFSTSSQVLDILDPTVAVANLSSGVVSSEFTFEPFGDQVSAMEATYEFPDTGTYRITQIVTTEHGCMDTISGTVEVKPHYTFYIPNAFTPNEDGLNEVWLPQGESIVSFDMTVCNRWNEPLFRTSSLNHGWDGTYRGKQVQKGTYVYQILVVDVLGEPHKYTGSFSLVR